MPQPQCDPFASCDGLDVQLIISTAMQGPPLAWDLGEVSFGSFTTTGAAARPYVDVALTQRWTAQEACYGPVRSIFSLAPGETVQTVTSVRHQVDLVSLVASVGSAPMSPVSRAAQQASVSTAKQEKNTAQGVDRAASRVNEVLNAARVERKTRSLGGYGSFWESVTDVFMPGLGEVLDVGEGISELIVGTTTDEASAVAQAVADETQAVETISRTESQNSRSESTTSTTHMEMFESITRTFANPYRDRSLQLRFIPVFRHFAVRIWPESVTAGISLHAGPYRGITEGPMQSTRDLFAGASSRLDMASLHGPLARMLSATPTAKSGRTASEGIPSAPAQGAFVWSRSSVREDSVFVPLAEPGIAATALGLEGRPRTRFLKALGTLRPELVTKLVPETIQHVHLFMGTHIEAVAGECVLQGVPPPSEQINEPSTVHSS